MRVFFVLLLLGSLARPSWASPDGCSARLERAKKLDEEGRYLEAAEEYKALFAMKNFAGLMFDTGNAFLKGKDAQQARTWCVRYLQESGPSAKKRSNANECVRLADALLKAQQRPVVKSTAARRPGQASPPVVAAMAQRTPAPLPAVKPAPVPAAPPSAALTPPVGGRPTPRPAALAPVLGAAQPQVPGSVTAAPPPAPAAAPASGGAPVSAVSPPPSAPSVPLAMPSFPQALPLASEAPVAAHAARPVPGLQSPPKKKWLAVGLSVGAVGVAALAVGLAVGIPRSQARTDWLADLPNDLRLGVKF